MKALSNTENLHNLEGKSSDMRDMSKLFAKNSGELASIMYWRNMKMNIIIGLIILAVLLYFIVPMFTGSSDSSTSRRFLGDSRF